MKEKMKELVPYILIVVGVVLLRTFIVTPIKINGSSMYDTLKGNEICILYKLGKIDRFDIIVTDYEGERLIKRVIAMPGETVEVENGFIYINDKKIKDEYGYGETDDFEKVTLEEDEYFVMGDNRKISKDSRLIGPIKENDISGTTNLILYPFNKIGKIDK